MRLRSSNRLRLMAVGALLGALVGGGCRTLRQTHSSATADTAFVRRAESGLQTRTRSEQSVRETLGRQRALSYTVESVRLEFEPRLTADDTARRPVLRSATIVRRTARSTDERNAAASRRAKTTDTLAAASTEVRAAVSSRTEQHAEKRRRMPLWPWGLVLAAAAGVYLLWRRTKR